MPQIAASATTSAHAAQTDSARCLLRVHDLSIGYGENVVLRNVGFSAPDRGVIALMGPSGGGKSTLLRTIGRWNDTQPSFWARGAVWFDGENLLDVASAERVHRWVPMLAQKARLYTGSVLDNLTVGIREQGPIDAAQLERLAAQAFQSLGLWGEFGPLLHEPALNLSMAAHKKILIARLLAGGARCLLADEPLRDIAVVEEDGLLALLRRVAEQRLVVLVTHNKIEARKVSDWVCFMTGGRLVELTPTAEFFERPRSELGREFLRSGSSWPSSTDMAVEDDTPALVAPMPIAPPRDFHWVIMRSLGGMQQPGLLGDLDKDLESLRALGVKVLVTLTETPLDAVKIQAFGIESVHFPIVDMSVPSLQQAESMCERVSAWIEGGRATVVHCKAGLGRTGTILACVLVYRGMNPMRAIEAVRTVKPGYIQTERQFDFVAQFAAYLDRTQR
ncbi:MAG: ATP-binding cassette domain-containing protein [Gammaproteobacteria bacterium]